MRRNNIINETPEKKIFWFVDQEIPNVKISLSGFPRHRENQEDREFRLSFFQMGKCRQFTRKYFKYELTQGIYPQHRENFKV